MTPARAGALALALLTVTGCMKAPRDNATQEETTAAGAAAAPALPARDLHVQNEPYPTYGAYGYVVFTSATPGVADTLVAGRREKRARHLATCAAYGDLPAAGGFGKADSLNLMVTFWPVVRAVPADSAACSALLLSYDQPLATRILAVVGHRGAKGPLLVAFARPFGGTLSGRGALVYDLSHFPDADLDRAFRVWGDEIARRPERWNDGFKVARIREAIRNALNLGAQGMPSSLVSLVGGEGTSGAPAKHD